MHGILIALVALSAASPSTASEPMDGRETAIPFISHDGIIDWKADGPRGVYLRSMNGRWYYARMQGRCGRLVTALALGFETSALDQLDRFGAIRAQGWRCPIASLVESPPPPKKQRR